MAPRAFQRLLKNTSRLSRRELLWLIGLPVAGVGGWGLRHFIGSRTDAASEEPVIPSSDAPQVEELRRLAGALQTLFAPLAAPAPDEWLAKHAELGQTFVQYVASNPEKLARRFQKVCIVPLGDLSETQQRLFADTGEFLERFFGFSVERLAQLPLDDLPDDAMRLRESGTRQVRTSYVLDKVLAPLRDEETAAVYGLTAHDLWDGDFNFLFGQGSMGGRVCVGSVARFGDVDSNEVDYATCLRRTVGLAVHETGHVFQFPHCIAWSCRMNGSNHLAEAERRPLEFCSECLPKIWWTCGVDPAQRFDRLLEFAEGHGLTRDVGLWRSARDRLAAARKAV